METVKLQDIEVNDLMWKIDYNSDRCIMCESRGASCNLKAIKVEVLLNFKRGGPMNLNSKRT